MKISITIIFSSGLFCLSCATKTVTTENIIGSYTSIENKTRVPEYLTLNKDCSFTFTSESINNGFGYVYGTWNVIGDSIILNSLPKPSEKPFVLIEKKLKHANEIEIEIYDDENQLPGAYVEFFIKDSLSKKVFGSSLKNAITTDEGFDKMKIYFLGYRTIDYPLVDKRYGKYLFQMFINTLDFSNEKWLIRKNKIISKRKKFYKL